MKMKMPVTMKVRNYHIDSYGHVNNAQYLIMLEEARTQFLEQVGCTLEDFYREGIFIFVNDIHIQFKKPAVLGDHLEICVWLSRLNRAKVIFRQEIRKAGSGELLATADVSCGFVRNNRVIPIPQEFIQIMQTYHIPDRT